MSVVHSGHASITIIYATELADLRDVMHISFSTGHNSHL
jgi:hypothetical protein